jgi:hypothetical protein
MCATETYGWDMVIAVRTGVLNSALTEGGASFDQTVPHGNGSVDVSAMLGAWQIATGGSGALVKFSVPCTKLKLSQGEKSFTFRDGAFLVEATLEFVQAAEGDGQDLRIKAGKGQVSAQAAEFDDPGFDGFAVVAVAGMQAWLDAQTGFPLRIAGLSPLAASQGGQATAFVPATASYAYADAADGKGGVLAFLCSVAAGDGHTANLLQEVDPAALSDGDGAVLVGKEVLTRILDLGLSRTAFTGAPTLSARLAGPLAVPLDLKEGA